MTRCRVTAKINTVNFRLVAGTSMSLPSVGGKLRNCSYSPATPDSIEYTLYFVLVVLSWCLYMVVDVVFYAMQRPIFTAGYDAMCHCHTCEEECTVVEILSVMDRRTQIKRKQRFAKEGSIVTAKFKVSTLPRLFLGKMDCGLCAVCAL